MAQAVRIFFIAVLAFNTAAVIFSGPLLASSKKKKPTDEYHLSGSYNLEYGLHTSAPVNASNERIGISLQEKARYNSRWSVIASGQAWYEGAYANDTTARPLWDDSYDVRLQETYVQYEAHKLVLRAGNQVIVWGETFGSFVADVVNPKDLRFGVPINLGDTHLASPMVTGKYLISRFSLQGLVIAQPMFNLLPVFGYDFAPANVPLNNYSSVLINRERSLPFGNLEYGARVSRSFDDFDLSLFDFEYFDRNPFYQLDHPYIPGQTFTLNEHHSPVNSAGQALAWTPKDTDLVVREEIVYTFARDVTILKPNAILSQLITDELGAAMSVELPPWKKFNFSFQYSLSHLQFLDSYITRSNQDIENVSQRTSVRLPADSTLSSIFTWSILDSGLRWQLDDLTPISDQLEGHAGAEIFFGNQLSDFGSISRAGRIYVSIKGYFFQ